jgi:hypothetical protein
MPTELAAAELAEQTAEARMASTARRAAVRPFPETRKSMHVYSLVRVMISQDIS